MYKYNEIKSQIFLEENQQLFLAVRDNVKNLLDVVGVSIICLKDAIAGPDILGDTFLMIACVDRLVELGEIREIPTTGRSQDRLFRNAG